ncbi:hypothetical protein [Methylorubrum populi]
MTTSNSINEANSLMLQQFALHYLLSAADEAPLLVEGASVEPRRVSNRTNVPAASVSMTYIIEHPELGFGFRFRAVWFDGALLPPSATHVVIEREWDNTDSRTPASTSEAINDWLQAVTP